MTMFITIPIVLWETFTGKSIIDKLWKNKTEGENDDNKK